MSRTPTNDDILLYISFNSFKYPFNFVGESSVAKVNIINILAKNARDTSTEFDNDLINFCITE